MQINAFQRAADVVIQKSLREGFGLTVAEGLWKGRPVIGGRAGGIVLQIRDGQDGYLVDSVEECARPHHRAARRPGQGRRHGGERQGARAPELPVDPRARGLADALRHAQLSGADRRDRRLQPRAVPVRRRTRTARSRPIAARAAWSARSMPLLGRPRGRHLGRRRDRRRRPRPRSRPARRRRRAGCTPGCSRSTRDVHAAALRRHLERRRSGSCTTGCSTSPAGPASTAASARRGRATSRSTGRSPTRSSTSPADGETRARAGLPARARARRCCATPRPDLHVVHFTHTPFCGPSSIRVLPEYVAHAICSSMARCTAGFHTERWAQRVPGVRARGARVRRRRSAARSRRRSVPTPRRSPPRSPTPEVDDGDRRARGARRRPAAHRAQRPHRALEEHRARLPRVRPAARGAPRAAGAGRRSPRC